MMSKGEKHSANAVTRRRGKDVVKSAGRSLEVLEFFRDAKQPMRLTDVAKALSLPQSSASMLIRSLIKMGYLVQYKRGYAPSMRITLLGNWLNDAMFKTGDLMMLIEEISHQTSDTVILATRNGLLVEVLAVVAGAMNHIHHTRPGDARPLTLAGLGHAILSTMNRDDVESLVMRINAEQKKPERRVKLQTLLPILDRIREKGFSYTEGTIPNSASVAMLLPPGPFGDQLVVGNAGAITRIRPRQDEIVKILKATIQKYLRT